MITELKLDREYTVDTLVTFLIGLDDCRWGFIGIKDSDWSIRYGGCQIKGGYFPERFMNKVVSRCEVDHYGDNVDYTITLKE